MYKSFIFGVIAVSAALAQPPGPPPGRMGFGGRGLMGPAGFARTVTGAPFSAVQVTTSQHVLADGNVISRQDQTTFYRDSQGRTRIETSFKHPDGTTSSHVTIHDPVAGVMHEINPESKVSRDSNFRVPPAGSPGGRAMARGRGPGGPAGTGHAMNGRGAANDANVVTENLGSQLINGISATGTRITRNIPAGAEGNSMPIQIVQERWVSDELQLPVLVKHSDPRMGTTTTQLTNIVRAEPDSSLFSVPAGYTVEKGPGRGPGGGPGRGPRGGNLRN